MLNYSLTELEFLGFNLLENNQPLDKVRGSVVDCFPGGLKNNQHLGVTPDFVLLTQTVLWGVRVRLQLNRRYRPGR